MQRKNNQAEDPVTTGGSNPIIEVFSMVISLHTEQARVFALSMVLGRQQKAKDGPAVLHLLAHRALPVKIRSRLTRDGGRTVIALTLSVGGITSRLCMDVILGQVCRAGQRGWLQGVVPRML